MSEILSEITPLSEKDCFYVVDRHKSEFVYPLHQHREFELNFICHAAGAQRVVGDSVEVIGEYDLVLICGENLAHVWKQGDCKSKEIREITIQFSRELISGELLSKNQFASIRSMLMNAEHGLSFPMDVILDIYYLLNNLATIQEKFYQFLQFLQILYKLSKADNVRTLSSSSFAHAESEMENQRIVTVKQYIGEHFSEDVSLETIAALVNMTPSAFSRFFKLRTGRTLSDYIIDMKLGYAARMLVDTSKSISEICYECGFNNQSNFNRIFKAKRGITPREFKAMYKKNKIIV